MTASLSCVNIDYTKSWISLLNIYDSAVNEGSGYVADALLNQYFEEILHMYLTPIWYMQFYSLISQNSVLCSFQGSQFEETIAKYKSTE